MKFKINQYTIKKIGTTIEEINVNVRVENGTKSTNFDVIISKEQFDSFSTPKKVAIINYLKVKVKSLYREWVKDKLTSQTKDPKIELGVDEIII